MKKLIKKVFMNYKYAKKINMMQRILHNMYLINTVSCEKDGDYKSGYRLTVNYLNKVIQKHNVSIFRKIHDYKEMVIALKNYSHKDISCIFQNKDHKSIVFNGAIAASGDFRKCIDSKIDEVNSDLLMLYKA